MKQRNMTFLAVVAGDRMAWHDLRTGKGGEILRRLHAPLDESLAELFKQAEIQRGASVLVMGGDLFTQTVRLPVAQTRGLSHEELKAALAYEVSPFSTIAPEQSETAFVVTRQEEGFQTWSVLQVARTEVAAVRSKVRAARGRLWGLAPVPAEFGERSLAELAQRAAAGSLQQPLIRPASEALGFRNLLVCGVAAVGLVALVCVAHAWMQGESLKRLQETERKRNNIVAANNEMAQANQRLKTQLQEFRGATTLTVQVYAHADATNAWHGLLTGLTTSMGTNGVVLSLVSNAPFDVSATCMADSTLTASLCLEQLVRHTAPEGWRVELNSVRETAGRFSRFDFRVRRP